MKRRVMRAFKYVLAAVTLLLPVSAAHAVTLHVAANGVDSVTCGGRVPCRSISRAIANANVRDTIIVGPGIYGDINRNGVLGEAGEESGSPYCNCMLWVNKDVILTSSDGAAVTVIDARSVDVGRNVVITAGGEFGRPGKGFTVTPTGRVGNYGMVIDADDLQVRGNQVVSSRYSTVFSGIFAQGSGSVLIEGNQATGWSSSGIVVVGTGKTVQKNVASQNWTGIRGEGLNTIENNIVTGNTKGLELLHAVTAVGNAAYGNEYGIQVYAGFTGTLEHNNIVGNRQCGLDNYYGVPFLLARNNYWGAATGPGLDPADTVCDQAGHVVLLTPFATRPFTVKAPIEP